MKHCCWTAILVLVLSAGVPLVVAGCGGQAKQAEGEAFAPEKMSAEEQERMWRLMNPQGNRGAAPVAPGQPIPGQGR
jgi:hypothetical protein